MGRQRQLEELTEDHLPGGKSGSGQPHTYHTEAIYSSILSSLQTVTRQEANVYDVAGLAYLYDVIVEGNLALSWIAEKLGSTVSRRIK